MGMTPNEFLESFVEGNYYDCVDAPGNVRRAFNAAVSAAHLADHYYNYHKRHSPSKLDQFRGLGDFVGYVSKDTGGAFKDIRSISNAYKHLYTSTDPKRESYISIASTGAIESVSLLNDEDDIDEIEEDFVASQHEGGFHSRVVFTRRDGQRIEFLPVLKVVVDYWYEFVYR